MESSKIVEEEEKGNLWRKRRRRKEIKLWTGRGGGGK